MNKLDSKIAEYYEKQELSKDSLERLLVAGELAANQRRGGSDAIGKRRARLSPVARRGLLVFAASFLIAVIVGQFYQLNKTTSELVLAEIAMNHNKRLDAEYKLKDFNELAVAMKRLDFNLKPPGNIAISLLGGRYCSIQGKLAAQLKVKLEGTDNDNVATLYITPITDRLMEIADQQTIHDNVTIQLWKDAGYFYGLAKDARL